MWTMKAEHVCLLLYVFSAVSLPVNTFDSCSAAAGVVVGVAAMVTPTVWTYFRESCDSAWTDFNATGLQHDLKTKLFGQHIASRIVLNAVYEFMTDKNPKKPLVLSLHGWTGTGKNFVSQLIAENIYKEGMDSSFVHFFTNVLHFPHSNLIETYKSNLQQWIKGNVTNCARSMFIFDEMDKMHPGLIESLEPFLDYREKPDKVSYQKAVFIFLSNAGGEAITQKALDFHKEGRDREKIKVKDLSISVFSNNKSGIWHPSLIDKNLVDFYVPFLPLEYRHVVQCVLAEMQARRLKPDQNVAKQVARDLVYFPKSDKLFSVSGCKKIKSKLDYII